MNLSPDAFWNLRLAEWRWLLSAGAPSADRFTRNDLESLITQYQDETNDRSR